MMWVGAMVVMAVDKAPAPLVLLPPPPFQSSASPSACRPHSPTLVPSTVSRPQRRPPFSSRPPSLPPTHPSTPPPSLPSRPKCPAVCPAAAGRTRPPPPTRPTGSGSGPPARAAAPAPAAWAPPPPSPGHLPSGWSHNPSRCCCLCPGGWPRAGRPVGCVPVPVRGGGRLDCYCPISSRALPGAAAHSNVQPGMWPGGGGGWVWSAGRLCGQARRCCPLLGSRWEQGYTREVRLHGAVPPRVQPREQRISHPW